MTAITFPVFLADHYNLYSLRSAWMNSPPNSANTSDASCRLGSREPNGQQSPKTMHQIRRCGKQTVGTTYRASDEQSVKQMCARWFLISR